MDERPLTRSEATAAVEAIGWRFVFGRYLTTVTVESLNQAMAVAATAATACAERADAHLRLRPAPDRVELSLGRNWAWGVTEREVELAHRITEAVDGLGCATSEASAGHAIQTIELAIDALDIPRVRPFWLAVLGYVDEPGGDGLRSPIVDPRGQGPTIWFQQMDAPRAQRNRIHLDVGVGHDEAPSRIAAAVAAGGRILDDSHGRAFWVLADPEGNEACVCTWQDRDELEA